MGAKSYTPSTIAKTEFNSRASNPNKPAIIWSIVRIKTKFPTNSNPFADRNTDAKATPKVQGKANNHCAIFAS